MQEQLFVKEQAETYLRMLGIGIKAMGYEYLKTSIIFACQDKQLLTNITTKLYIKVAEQFGVNSKSVERNIRTVVDSAYQVGDLLEINSIYGKIVYKNDFKLSNGELISLIATKIQYDAKRQLLLK